MTTLTKEELEIDTQEAPMEDITENGIKVDGKGDEEDANN